MATPIMRIRVSPARRWFGIIMLFLLAVLLVWLGAGTGQASLALRLLLSVLGVAAFWLTLRMYRATGHDLILTEAGLEDGAGRDIARIEEISSVDRGAFAFKPSQGFIMLLKKPRGSAWAPGLWWRIGRRVGVGGVLPQAAMRLMAEEISQLVDAARAPD